MSKGVCSVSPVIYLYRIGILDWLPKVFDEVFMPSIVLDDLLEGRFIGYDVPSPFDLPWMQYKDPQLTVPSAWMSLDLSSGEVAAMSLAFETPQCVVLLDDPVARRADRLAERDRRQGGGQGRRLCGRDVRQAGRVALPADRRRPRARAHGEGHEVLQG